MNYPITLCLLFVMSFNRKKNACIESNNDFAEFSFLIFGLFITFCVCKSSSKIDYIHSWKAMYYKMKLQIKASNLLSLATVELYLLNDEAFI